MSGAATPHFLLTNDDGISAEGIYALRNAVEPLGQVTTVAPQDHMSATSHSISLYRPLSYKKLANDSYSVDGTPVDAVILALHKILSHKPTFVLSGINQGGNLGQNVYYSGTVAAAVEGTFNGIPSVAISLAALRGSSFSPSMHYVRHLMGLLIEHGIPQGVTLNVNVPYGRQHRGARITRRADRHARRIRLDPNRTGDGSGWWIREELQHGRIVEGTDHAAIRDGYISVCPLIFDPHDTGPAGELEEWMLKMQPLLHKL
jgi:5'-nucleotidase